MQRQAFCVLVLVAGACALGSRLSGEGRVTSGNEAEGGQFPYQVSIQWDGAISTSHKCGGAILNENWIITAAHCVVNPPSIGKFVIVAGETDLRHDEGTEQIVGVKNIYPHPDYPLTAEVDANDIALVHLWSPLTFGPGTNVSQIGLPPKNEKPNGGAVLSGWGVNGGIILPNHPDILQYAAVTIENITDCRERFPNATLFDTNFCSRGRVATCSEDDGSPVVGTRVDGTKELVGIVAWPTSPCADSSQPSVYTQVSAFNDFINGIINA